MIQRQSELIDGFEEIFRETVPGTAMLALVRYSECVWECWRDACSDWTCPAEQELFAFVETDGCFTDGVAAATGCTLGPPHNEVVDYGKVAVTFVDTATEKAVRVWPNPDARQGAWKCAPEAEDGWHAQFEGYKKMPTCELLLFEPVHLLVSIKDIVSKPGLRVECARCGEGI